MEFIRRNLKDQPALPLGAGLDTYYRVIVCYTLVYIYYI